MKRFLIALCALCVCGVVVAAPALPPVGMGLPRVFNSSLLKESEVNRFMQAPNYSSSSLTEKPWIVYSDRADNVTYVAPSTSSAKCTTLKFNETLRIAKVQGNFALVYYEPRETGSLSISQDAVSKGWIPMDRLLLWNSSLASDQGIYYKALLCRSLDNAEQNAQTLPEVTCYYDPTRNDKFEKIPHEMDFFFVMKRQGNRVLLARHSRISTMAVTDQLLLGWLDSDAFAHWNQRSCVEPTWQHRDVEYFADGNIQMKVFTSKAMKDLAASMPFKRKTYESKGSKYVYRMDGGELRYPLLDNGDSRVYNISTFQTMGKDTVIGGMSDAEKHMMEVLEKKQRINLAVVIDGTSSMEDYYQPVKEAIKSGIEYFNTDKYKFNVGVVIYRDYADGEAGLVEVLPLTNVRNNMDRIGEFLDDGGKYGIGSADADKTAAEALYYGIDTALDTLRFKEGESNMMLIVGDCGNDVADTRISRETLVEKMRQKQVHVMGFQVRNKPNDAFSNFNSQIIWLIRNTLIGNYQALDASLTIKNVPDPNREGYDYKPSVGKEFYIGSYRRAIAEVNNGEMNPAKLAEHMKFAIRTFSESTQEQIDFIYKKGKAKRFTVGGTSDVGLRMENAFLEKTLGADWIEKTQIAQVLTFKGYTVRKHSDGREFYKPIIFIAESEFRDLMKKLSRVNQVAEMGDVKNRKAYYDSMVALVKSLAPGLSDSELSALSNDQITQIIGGLNEAPSSLKKYKLIDITNERAISTEQYQSILDTFKDKYRNLNLQVLQSKAYKYKKKFGDITYYWLPIEMLP